jgi:hypothetical protein
MNWLGYRGTGGKKGSSIVRASAEIRIGTDNDISDAPCEGHAGLDVVSSRVLCVLKTPFPRRTLLPGLCSVRDETLPQAPPFSKFAMVIQDELPNDDDDDGQGGMSNANSARPIKERRLHAAH